MTNKIPGSVCDDTHAEHLRNDVQDVLAIAEAMAGSPEARAQAAEVVRARLSAPAQGAAAAIAAADERRAKPPAAVGAGRQFSQDMDGSGSPRQATGSPRVAAGGSRNLDSPRRTTDSPRAGEGQQGEFGSAINSIGMAALKQDADHTHTTTQAMRSATTAEEAIAAARARNEGPSAGAAASLVAAEMSRAAAAAK